MKAFQRALAIVMGMVLLYTLALGARRVVLETQYDRFGDDLPFTLESALYYRRVKMLFDTGRLPQVDKAIQYPEGVDVRRTYTVGAEYVYAALARAWPKDTPIAARLRWLESGWFCLGIPFLALGLYGWRRSWWAAGVGAGFYAVALSSVMRSTGQELSHENFALPLLVAHGALDVTARRAMRRGAAAWCSVLSSVLLALALCAWDLVQFYILLRFLCAAADAARGRLAWASRAFGGHAGDVAALVLVGALNAYHREHGWLLSTPMWIGYGALGLAMLDRWTARARGAAPTVGRPWRRAGLLAAVVALGMAVQQLTPYAQAYGHFGELLWAKLRFLNHKPADPALLTFDQRIMWVPALHSTTLPLLHMLFPFMLYLTLPAAFVCYVHSRKLPGQGLGRLVFLYGSSLLAFLFFARFHVFLSLFAAALLGVWASLAAGQGRWVRWSVALLLGTGIFAEAAHTLQHPARWGRVNVYYKELDELAGWLVRRAAPDPVLANFGVSATIAAYGKCAILLHPKFEDAVLRQRVKEYGEQLFQGTERSFRDWADDHGAQYYVYAYGEFSRESPELQMRYFVNALEPREDAPARRFEYDPENMTYFQYVAGNVKYALFKMVTRADEAQADREAARAREAFERGDLDRAEAACIAAMKFHPRHPPTVELLAHVTSLRAAGFRPAPAEGN